ncbi:MAG: hypothetical protein M1829_006886 [Trizodia sp. TS-e1964]|nr:MAG: hypothetical protein M1829_006886 [Trizodia sp. TS-e1964]
MESRPNPPDASRVAISSDQELAVEQAAAEPPPQPGPRARALQKVFDNALSASLKACSYENFAACFPTPARYVPERLEGLWQNMMARIREFAQREFEAILSERAVVPALNGLDRLIAEARARRDSTLSAGGEVPVA